MRRDPIACAAGKARPRARTRAPRGHGLMIAPAVGKVLSELIRTGRATTVDVGCFAADRFDRGALVHDEAMV